MSETAIYNVLIGYLCFVPLITMHEWAHAWVAWKCGDNTAYHQGRVTMNPVAHMELIGTVVLPLLASFVALSNPTLAGFIIGWGRPVPVNAANLRRPRVDETLVTIAGPTMNFILAFALIAVLRLGVLVNFPWLNALEETCIRTAAMSLSLCFFNLIPIPPLDGSHILKNLTGMDQITYYRFAQYGFIAVMVVVNLPGVREGLWWITVTTLTVMVSVLGLR
jgi:Zn-dependent protease